MFLTVTFTGLTVKGVGNKFTLNARYCFKGYALNFENTCRKHIKTTLSISNLCTFTICYLSLRLVILGNVNNKLTYRILVPFDSVVKHYF